ncbi:MAG: hypothetical protein ACLR5G_07445 [Eubacteriales bacterium]
MENEIIHDPIILSAKCAPVTGTDEDIDDAVALSVFSKTATRVGRREHDRYPETDHRRAV